MKRIFREQLGNHGRVEVGADTRNCPLLEINYPAVTIVEAHAVLCGCQGMQLNHCLVTLDDQIFHMQLRALR